jgi:hypothetical protein
MVVESVKSQGGFESALGLLSTGQWLSIPFILIDYILCLLLKRGVFFLEKKQNSFIFEELFCFYLLMKNGTIFFKILSSVYSTTNQ